MKAFDVLPGGWRAVVLYSNFPVGAVALGLILGNYTLLGLPPDGPLLVLALAGVVLIYQVDRSIYAAPEDAENEPERVRWLCDHRRVIRASMLVAGLIVVVLAPFVQGITLVVGGVMGMLGLLYAAPILPGHRRIKSIWYLKPILIGGSWAIGSVILPVIEAGDIPGRAAWMLTAYRFFFIIPNVLVADWHDRHGDCKTGLSSVATIWPLRRIRRLGLGSLSLTLVGAVLAVVYGHASTLLLLDALGPALMCLALIRMQGGSNWYYGFWIDAIVAWPMVTWVASHWMP